MYIIAVDDERPSLNVLTGAIREGMPDCSLSAFSNPLEALYHAQNSKVDVAFLDIRMGDMDGVSLAEELKNLHPKINIIFVTGYTDYTLDALNLRASGYVCKPVSAEAVKKELKELRHIPESENNKPVRIQTFGNFEIFMHDTPVVFHRNKAKEVLAYLVDRRGATVTKKELATVLWEEREYNRNTQIYLQILISEMIRALNEAGAGDIIRRQHNSLSVIPDSVECDYYNFIKGDPHTIESFHDEYMVNYSWAEMTAGTLSRQKDGRSTQEKQ
ncbi:response regulator [Brucepastera parasyntrophica]|uniref:response regulator n=1 Tax=Brucepastera parasyntrophica TaxID=2880008 RepID=UPI0021098652|nr:response regulator [Brucepastera parasyntrophica]ULQ60455.1 response regulator [Brucepastera parasyntrophica]